MAAGVVNENLVTKQLEDFSESGTIEPLLNSGDIDTRTGLLNALVICHCILQRERFSKKQNKDSSGRVGVYQLERKFQS